MCLSTAVLTETPWISAWTHAAQATPTSAALYSRHALMYLGAQATLCSRGGCTACRACACAEPQSLSNLRLLCKLMKQRQPSFPIEQVLANNTFNPASVPGTPINVTSLRPTPIGQRRLRIAWRRADVTSFPSSWTTPLPTPPGTMNATVPLDAVGRPRTPTQNLVGADSGLHINLLQMGN